MARLSGGPSPAAGPAAPAAGCGSARLQSRAGERSGPLPLERRGNSYSGERGLKKKNKSKTTKKPMRKEAANVKWVTHGTGD